jgi:hypothetical protein
VDSNAPEEGSRVLAVEPDTRAIEGQTPAEFEPETTADLRQRVTRMEEMLRYTLNVLEVAISGENQRAEGASNAIYVLAHRLGNVESAVFRR